MLAAFKTYYETAQLEATTDPHLVFDLRAKLDASGFTTRSRSTVSLKSKWTPRVPRPN